MAAVIRRKYIKDVFSPCSTKVFAFENDDFAMSKAVCCEMKVQLLIVEAINALSHCLGAREFFHVLISWYQKILIHRNQGSLVHRYHECLVRRYQECMMRRYQECFVRQYQECLVRRCQGRNA